MLTADDRESNLLSNIFCRIILFIVEIGRSYFGLVNLGETKIMTLTCWWNWR